MISPQITNRSERMGMSSVTEKNHEGGDKAKSSKPPRPNRICFSFAAYANDILNCLKASKVIIDQGLSDAEFSNIESKLKFTFPPDLRAFLQQGLPVSQGFPNWRSSSTQQLQILLSLPASSILRRVQNTRFWHPSWGPQPPDPTPLLSALLRQAPALVPIYRHCYIPSSPDPGNPVFYIDHGGDVRLLSFDVAGFFREFLAREPDEPVWAARAARRVSFWSEVAEKRCGTAAKGEVARCLEKVVWRLREGGWTEEEIRDMMMTDEDDQDDDNNQNKLRLKDKEAMAWHVRVMSLVLLRAGWSREDVVYSLGVVGDETKSWFELDFHQDHSNVNINAF